MMFEIYREVKVLLMYTPEEKTLHIMDEIMLEAFDRSCINIMMQQWVAMAQPYHFLRHYEIGGRVE